MSRYRGKVAILFQFAPNGERPSNYRLIKNYIDLVKDVALQDDRQVEVVVSEIIPAEKEPDLQVTIIPMHLYKAQFDLGRQLRGIDNDDDDELEEPEFGLDQETFDFLYDRMNEEGRIKLVNSQKRMRQHSVLSKVRADDLMKTFRYKELAGSVDVLSAAIESTLSTIYYIDPYKIVFELPFNEGSAMTTIEEYKRLNRIESFDNIEAVDLLVDIVNFPDIDIDNLFHKIEGILRKSGLLVKAVGDIRLHRLLLDVEDSFVAVQIINHPTIYQAESNLHECLENAEEDEW